MDLAKFQFRNGENSLGAYVSFSNPDMSPNYKT